MPWAAAVPRPGHYVNTCEHYSSLQSTTDHDASERLATGISRKHCLQLHRAHPFAAGCSSFGSGSLSSYRSRLPAAAMPLDPVSRGDASGTVSLFHYASGVREGCPLQKALNFLNPELRQERRKILPPEANPTPPKTLNPKPWTISASFAQAVAAGCRFDRKSEGASGEHLDTGNVGQSCHKVRMNRHYLEAAERRRVDGCSVGKGWTCQRPLCF